MQTLVTFAKTKGFVYQGSEIYGGLANSWDYAPLGALLKENIKNLLDESAGLGGVWPCWWLQ